MTRAALITSIAVLVMLPAAAPVRAQSVQVQMSSTEAFVGESLEVRVVVSNMSERAVPVPPETAHFEIQANPGNPTGRSQRISIVNGRRTQSTDYTYVYYVRSLRTGRLVLPPFSVVYKGLTHHTRQMPIVVTKATSSSSLFCEIKTERDAAFVGEAVSLTLEVWIRQYSQGGIGTLDALTMWGGALRDMQATTMGVFDGADWDRSRYREATRRDDEGVAAKYYVYIIETTVYPTKAGEFDFGGVAVAYRYPKRLGRGRGVFARLHLEDSRRLRAVAKTPRLEIKPIPMRDRPADFSGAIGAYLISAKAAPTDGVPVGDPITLTLSIGGTGRLEQLRAPKLDEVEALARDFEVARESLAGEIRVRRKLFSQTIRPLREDVTEIPPIPMSFLNPTTGTFETVYSRAIPITVTPAERMDLPTLPGPGSTTVVLAPLVESTEGLQANYTETALLLADQSGVFGVWTWGVLGLGPALYVGAWFVRRRVARYRDDEAFRRRSRAYATARRALKAAGAAASPSQVSSALTGYIADRYNLPAGGVTRADVVETIAKRGVSEETIQAVDALLESLELAQYGGAAADVVRDSVASARDLVDALERGG